MKQTIEELMKTFPENYIRFNGDGEKLIYMNPGDEYILIGFELIQGKNIPQGKYAGTMKLNGKEINNSLNGYKTHTARGYEWILYNGSEVKHGTGRNCPL